jgi:hypothetical protein
MMQSIPQEADFVADVSRAALEAESKLPHRSIGITFNKKLSNWVSIICLTLCLLIHFIHHTHLSCLSRNVFLLQELNIYRHKAKMCCGVFKLKSDAIAAKVVADDTIDEYIRSTFNVENSAALTTEQRVTLLNWWKNKMKMDKSLITRENG